ncbi:hypothetical protein RV09_GL001752 [Enterococcus moraviensis]|nr:hypothetical protein RV09_GL001752 [Enterococcus moraviensis]
MDLRIPENTIVANSFSYDIVANDGTVIMTISGDSSSNTAIATFGPYYETHKANRQGEILFYARGATTVENEDWVMNKVGWNSLDNTSAVWNIIINPDSNYITNVILTDQLGEMQVFDSGFLIQADLGTYDKTTQSFEALEPIDPSKIIASNDGFVIELGILNNAVSLTYVSNKLGDTNVPYKNKAILEADGDGDPVVIDAETPGIGGGGTGSGDPGEPDPEESTSESMEETSTEEIPETSETSTEETSTEEIPGTSETNTEETSTEEIPGTSETNTEETSTEEIPATSETSTESSEESTSDTTTETSTPETDPEETTSQTQTIATESSLEETTATTDSHIESSEESLATSTTESTLSELKKGSSSDSKAVGTNSSKGDPKNASRLPNTGDLKSLIELAGYGLIMLSMTFLFVRKKYQNDSKRK